MTARSRTVARMPEIDIGKLDRALRGAMNNRGPDGTREPLTQTQVADQAEVHKATLANLLNHGQAPSLPEVVRLMRWLRMEPGEFWRDTEPAPDPDPVAA